MYSRTRIPRRTLFEYPSLFTGSIDDVTPEGVEADRQVGTSQQRADSCRRLCAECRAYRWFGDMGANISNDAVVEANADYRRKVRTTIDSMKHKAKHGHQVAQTRAPLQDSGRLRRFARKKHKSRNEPDGHPWKDVGRPMW
jgi:hypothetical protein